MKFNLDNYLGSKPCLYGRQLLKDMDIKDHYVDEYKVAEFLGYEVEEITDSKIEEFKQRYSSDYDIGDIFDDNFCAVSIPKENKMFIHSKLFKNRKRLTILHETGHEIIPWHIENVFSIKGNDIDPILHKKIEREAFLACAEILYPLKHFVDDSLSISSSFSSIDQIAKRYNASFEATCIRYALASQKRIAIAVIKENELTEEEIITNNGNGYRQIVFSKMPPSKKIKPASTAPLRVQYCSRSYCFAPYITSGREIQKDNIIYKCWSQKESITGEIPASVFGSSQKFKYDAECIYFQDKVFVLLSLPNTQIEFFRGVI